jgi:hypothetical protein
VFFTCGANVEKDAKTDSFKTLRILKFGLTSINW